VFENRMPRRINRSFVIVVSASSIRVVESRIMRWARHVKRTGDMRRAYNILVGMSEEKRRLWRSRRRWKDCIKMGVKEIGYDCSGWC
jgi:hypothetical protein